MFSLNTKGIRDRIDRLSYIPASQGNAQRLKMINLSFSYAKSRDPLTLYILWEYKKKFKKRTASLRRIFEIIGCGCTGINNAQNTR